MEEDPWCCWLYTITITITIRSPNFPTPIYIHIHFQGKQYVVFMRQFKSAKTWQEAFTQRSHSKALSVTKKKKKCNCNYGVMSSNHTFPGWLPSYSLLNFSTLWPTDQVICCHMWSTPTLSNHHHYIILEKRKRL